MALKRSQSILMVAGEVSGDMHAAEVVRRLKTKNSKLRIFGMGGPLMAQAGMEVREDLTKQALIGFWEVVKHYPWIKKRFDQCVHWLETEKPDLLFLIDYPGFNLRLAEKAHELGIPVCYYVAPQVWAWHKNRIHQIRRVVKKLLVILPFEEKFFKEEKVPAVYVGHPLVEEMVFKTLSRAKALSRYKIPSASPLIVVMPGSRKGEVAKLWPLSLEAARELRKKHPQAAFVVPRPSGLSSSDYPGITPQDRVYFVPGPAYDLRQRADLAWVKSGTGTLETALLKTPMVVIYRVSALSGFLAKRFLTIPYVSLVNILLGKKLVTELLQEQATAAHLVQESLALLEKPSARRTQLKGYATLRKMLSRSSKASANAAREITKLLATRS